MLRRRAVRALRAATQSTGTVRFASSGAGKPKPNIHLAYVPDGNRRYAAEKGISLRESYQISFLHSIQLVEWMLADHPRIKDFTIGLAAEYNLSRVSDQAVSLVQASSFFMEHLRKSPIHQKGAVEVRVIGEHDRAMKFCTENRLSTREFETPFKAPGAAKRLTFNLAFAYNGEKALLRAQDACRAADIEPTLANCDRHFPAAPVTLFLRAAQPAGFVRVSSYFPGQQQARLVSTQSYPHTLSRDELAAIVHRFENLKDSFDKM